MNKALSFIIYHLSFSVALMALMACQHDGSSDEGRDRQPLTISVAEEPWQLATASVTRSGETLAALQKSGFGLMCADTWFKADNLQVTWHDGQWSYGTYLWPNAITQTDVYAYAPYDAPSSTPSYSDGQGTLAITTTDGTATTDLLWAQATLVKNQQLNLTFRHALAKVSFGTLTNAANSSITLEQIELKGTLNTSGTLNLANGQWTNLASASKTITRTTADKTVAAGASVSIGADDILLIPTTDAALTLTFTMDGQPLTATAPIPTTQGVDRQVSITIDSNLEVTIKEN